MSDSDIDVKQGRIVTVAVHGGRPETEARKGRVMLVVGLNQTIDRTLRLDALAPGQVLRASDVAVTAGGKAVNVCRAAFTLGAAPTLVGVFPGSNGRAAIDLLQAEGITVSAVPVPGEIRGTTVVIESSGRTTVINEPGPPIAVDDWCRLIDAVGDALGHDVLVAISGSVPPGTPADAHRILIQLVHDRGGRVAVDVTGQRLLAAAAAGADIVSPNLVEAEQALSGPEPDRHPPGEAVDADAAAGDVVARACAAADALVRSGAGGAIVSAGRHGVACRTAAVDEFVAAPPVEPAEVLNPIGAGDALLGATLVALEHGRTFVAAVRCGVAYAAASVTHAVAGYADAAVAARFVEQLTADPGQMVAP